MSTTQKINKGNHQTLCNLYVSLCASIIVEMGCNNRWPWKMTTKIYEYKYNNSTYDYQTPGRITARNHIYKTVTPCDRYLRRYERTAV